MARTHGATQNAQPTSRFHQDDGVLLGKGGVPIPTSPIRGITALNPHGAPVVAEAVAPVVAMPVVPDEFVWVSDKTTWQRNMDGWVAMQILDAMLGGIAVTLTDEQARKLPSDCRWHFKRRPKPVAAKDDAE